MNPRVRAYAGFALKLALGVALIAALVWRLDARAIGAAFARLDAWHVAAALAMFVASWPIAAWRWQLFAPEHRFARLFELGLVGQFYAIVLPGQLAGEAVKAYRLAKGQAQAERLAASVVMDRLVGTIALLAVAMAGIALTPHALPTVLRHALIALVAALLVVLFAFRATPIYRLSRHAVALLCALPRLARLREPLERLIDAWRDFAGKPWRLAASLGLGVAFQLLALGTYATLGDNLGIALPAADWAWIVAVTSVAVLLPLSIGGIGLREGALVGCLAYLGVPGESAIALSFAVFALMLSGAFAGGVVELGRASTPVS